MSIIYIRHILMHFCNVFLTYDCVCIIILRGGFNTCKVPSSFYFYSISHNSLCSCTCSGSIHSSVSLPQQLGEAKPNETKVARQVQPGERPLSELVCRQPTLSLIAHRLYRRLSNSGELLCDCHKCTSVPVGRSFVIGPWIS